MRGFVSSMAPMDAFFVSCYPTQSTWRPNSGKNKTTCGATIARFFGGPFVRWLLDSSIVSFIARYTQWLVR